MRRLCFHADAWDDYLFWQSNDRQVLKRLNRLIADTLRSPFSGVGKPEALKGELSGLWSRRIMAEHRLVYRVQDDAVIILQCRFHY